nr:MAG TPA: hypothetical protein [Caudoviricetes sp.]
MLKSVKIGVLRSFILYKPTSNVIYFELRPPHPLDSHKSAR